MLGRHDVARDPDERIGHRFPFCEPPGGAQSDHEETFRLVSDRLDAALRKLERRSADELVRERHDRYRAMGVFEEK